MNAKEILLALCLGLAAASVRAKDDASSLVYIGTRGTPQTSTGPQGIYAARLDTATGKLTPLGQQLELSRISWLLAHPSRPILFMLANPNGSTTVESQIYSYSLDKATGKLQPISDGGTGGKDTTHLAFDVKSNTLFGASFVSGEVMSLPVMPDGSIGRFASSQKHYGRGPLPEQNMPHAHAVALDATRHFVVSADLGADRIFVHRFYEASRGLTEGNPPFETAPPGSGPRHLVFHPNGRFLYVNTQMTAEVRAYQWDAAAGRLQLIEALAAYPADYAGEGEKSSAEIGFSRDGRHLYVTLRGDQNSIVAYDVDGKTGRLKEIQRIATQGKSPRTFAIDPSGRWMLVAHDGSSMVNVFAIDKATGKLSPTGESLPVPNAASLAFYPN
jgi:6-phosphogluconolactonase